MIPKRPLIISLVAVSGVLLPTPPFIDRADVQQPAITVGPNVQVSAPSATAPHYEVLAASDPDHAGRMIACSHVDGAKSPTTGKPYHGQHCYVTFDTGRTWQASLTLERYIAGDPAAAYGRGDTVFVATLGGTDSATGMGTLVYRSIDGGKTWQQPPARRPFMDREYLSVDRTGKYPGRIYMHGTGFTQGIDAEGPRSGGGLAAVRLYYSTDGGTTFQGPAERHFVGYGLGAENSNTVLTDGTFAAFFAVTLPGRSQGIPDREKDMGPNAALYVVTSTNGGDSLNMPVRVASWRMDRPRSEGAVLGQIASDPSSGPFRDRMYVVYTENVDNRLQIRMSYSADKGKSWSQPRTMNDEILAPGSKGGDHILPAVAVNKDGVVLVAWYDRREFPDGDGWRIRATASLDGGETWLPSVAVSSSAHSLDRMQAQGPRGSVRAWGRGSLINFSAQGDGFITSGGHTTGLVADASGTFYPIWVDNRTGIAQLWTAPVVVHGKAVKHGSADLADLEDVSDRLALYFADSKYDGTTGEFVATVCLKNLSKDTIRAPFKGRLLQISSPIGSAIMEGAENGLGGVGGVWDFTKLVPSGVLLPDSASRATQLRVIITGRKPLGDGRYGASVFSAGLRLLAKAPASTDTAGARGPGRRPMPNEKETGCSGG